MKKEKEVNLEMLTVGSVVICYSEMMFIVVYAENGKQFSVVEISDGSMTVKAPLFDSLSEMYGWFFDCENDGIKTIVPAEALLLIIQEYL